MPRLGSGTECIALLLSQVSKDMQQSITPMLFPSLGAHISGAEFMYPDLSWKEPCGLLANLVADSGAGKGQLSSVLEAVCRDFRQHDDEELSKLVEWQKMMKTKSANKEKPARPDVAFWFPPADVTNAAFIQNAMGSARARNTSTGPRWRWPTACVADTDRYHRCCATSMTASVPEPCAPRPTA